MLEDITVLYNQSRKLLYQLLMVATFAHQVSSVPRDQEFPSLVQLAPIHHGAETSILITALFAQLVFIATVRE